MKCCDSPIVSFKEHKEDPMIKTCIYHKDPNISFDDFVKTISKYWYEKGRRDELERPKRYGM